MQITRIAEHSWHVHFDANWAFVQFMWRAILENDRGLVTLDNLKNLSTNIKKEPLSEFQNDSKLKDVICKECETLYQSVNSLPKNLKLGKFVLTINHEKQCLDLSVF